MNIFQGPTCTRTYLRIQGTEFKGITVDLKIQRIRRTLEGANVRKRVHMLVSKYHKVRGSTLQHYC